MKNRIITILLCFGFYSLFSQCSTVPVEEAARNGDFELGYLPGPVMTGSAATGASHTYTAGSDLDFASSLSYAGKWGGRNGSCKYGMANQYGVGRVENPACRFGGKQIVYGQYTGANKYKDHTTGTDKGYALFIDFNAVSGTFKHVWRQTVNVYGSQKYYFSAWFAQYGGNQARPTLRFKVQSFDAGGNLIETKTVGTAPVAPPAMQWQQFNGAYDTPPNAVSAVISIECKPTGQPNQDDFMIDDISFINSCQNINSQVAYTVDFNKDEVNFCEIGGEYVATVLKDNGTPITSAGKTITWYEGASDPQTELSSWANNPAPTITEPGTYRVCVVDPANSGCTVGSTVVTKEELNINVSDYVLCNPATEDIDLGLTVPNDAYNLDWTGPSGSVSNSSVYTVSKAGSHSVSATPINGYDGCLASDNFMVTTNLPESDTVDYCEGGGSNAALSVSDGNSYNWSTNKNMNNIIHTGNSYNYPVPNGSNGVIKLWVQNAETSPLGIGGSSAFNNYPDGVWNLSFTTTEYVKLKSFDVWGMSWVGGCGAGGSVNYTFNITGSANISHVQRVNCTGKTTINIDALLPPGNYVLKTNKKLKSTNSTGRRNLGGGKVIINTAGKSMFGNLNFRSSNACAPVPMVLNPVSCCTAPSDNPTIDIPSSSLEVCSPDKGEVVSVSGLTNGLDYQWQESSDGITWTDISGETGDVTGGQITLSNLSTNSQWYKYILAEDGNLGKACVKTSDSVQLIIKPKPIIDSIGVTPNQTTFCEGEAYNLEAHVNETSGYPVTYIWKQDGSGTDSLTNGVTVTGSPNYEVIVDANGCLDTLNKSITISPMEIADVTDSQGDFCINDNPNPILTYETGTTPNGNWSLESSFNATIDANSGELSLINSGNIRAYYQTPGVCFGLDSIDVTIQPAMEVEFLTLDTNFCKKDVTFPLRLTTNSNTGGIWTTWDLTNNTSISAVNSSGVFNATGLNAGDYTVKYVMNGFNSFCSDSDSITVTINPLDTVIITNPPSLCSSDNPYQLTLDITQTTSGDWTDSIGGNSYVTNGGVFDPSGLPDGSIKVIFTSDGACPGADTAYVTVTSQIDFDLPDGDQTFCLNNNPDTISINVNTGGGKFWTTSGEGISADSMYVVFSEYSGGQVDSLYYGKAGRCGDTAGIELTLLDVDTAEVDSFPAVCSDAPAFNFTCSPRTTAGGDWSGTGITDVALGTFDPSTAGPGIHTIKYTTLGNCPTSDSVQIVVKPRLAVSIDSLSLAFCGTASAQTAVANLNLGVGRWEKSSSWPGDWDTGLTFDNDSTITFDPNAVTPNTDSIFYMIDSSPFVCGDTATLRIGISSMETADIDTVFAICSGDASFDFTVTGTQGGTWSGIGIIDGAQGTFDPSTAGPGVHTIRYQTPGVCFVWDSLQIVVRPRVNVSIDSLSLAFCGTASAQTAVANLHLGVGRWEKSSSWPGDWDAGLTFDNDSTISFDPNAVTPNTDSIFYM
ncbi:MAG: hypothetical protein ACJ0QJ_05330, partial [Flavobacteriales bacterium]